VVGVAVVAILLVTMKGEPAGQSAPLVPSAVTEAPEAAFHRALAAGQPTLAFFHSQVCDSCIEMTEIVAQVYPEFADSVTLIDVDVYDPRNDGLLKRARILGIPTVVVIDRAGEGTWLVGVTGAGQLRELLLTLAAGS
jgi:thioredoxin-like negative regulator of GroEL